MVNHSICIMSSNLMNTRFYENLIKNLSFHLILKFSHYQHQNYYKNYLNLQDAIIVQINAKRHFVNIIKILSRQTEPLYLMKFHLLEEI